MGRYLIGMDDWNIRNMTRITEATRITKSINTLLEFAGSSRDVADPWYTGDFELPGMTLPLDAMPFWKNTAQPKSVEINGQTRIRRYGVKFKRLCRYFFA